MLKVYVQKCYINIKVQKYYINTNIRLENHQST